MLHRLMRGISKIVIMAILGILSSCNNDIFIPDIQPERDQDINISVRISAGPQNSTRSFLTEEFGSQIENKLDLAKLKILIFDDQDTLYDIWFSNSSAADDITLSPIGNSDYILNAKLSADKYSSASKFSIVTLSNWNPLNEADDVELVVGKTLLNDLSGYIYGLNKNNPEESWIPSDDSLIPMFGVLYTSLNGYSTAIFNENNPMELGTVNLLRSLVKIEIQNNSGSNVAEITSVTLNKRNTRGYLLPSLVRNENTAQVTSTNIPSTGIMNPAGYTEEKLKFHKDGNLYVAYIPEIDLGNSIESRSNIDVNIVYNNFHETRKIVLAPYDSDKNPHIPAQGWQDEWKGLLRNHIYRFTINSITADPNLDLDVEVQPYSCVDIRSDFGFERTDDGYIVVRDHDGNIIKYIRTDGSVLIFKEDNSWPDLGTFTGVFDDTKRVLIGYFNDGRSIYFNYQSEERDDDRLDSWEIYSTTKNKNIPVHLEETFCYVDYDNLGTTGGYATKKFTHTILDDKGRVVEQYRYTSRAAFENRKNSTAGRIKLAEYKATNPQGSKYGDKVINYYKEDGTLYCQIIVTGDKEEYLDKDFIDINSL